MKEPKIRFQGFEGKWEESTIGKVTSVNRGVRVTRKNLSDHGLYPVYQNTDYPMGYYNRYNVESNNPFVIIGGSAGLIGFCDKDFWAADDCAYFSDSVKIDKFYLYCMLLNKSSEIKKNVRGSSVPRLDRQVINDLNISLPSIKEQQSIASYFQHLDSLIQSTTKKIESLKQVKAASLQSMFPQEGETTPRVRFKGFEGEWEKVSFGQFGSVAMCKRIFKDQTMDKGEVPFYKIGTFAMEPDAYISKELFIEYKSKFSFPQKGDILISAAGTIGRTIQYNGEDAYFQDSNIVWLKHGNEIDNTFLMYIYSLVKWNGLEGATIKRLYNNIILETEFLLPPVEEQRAIASFFTILDRKITLHTQRLEKLKQIKSACLDNMFV